METSVFNPMKNKLLHFKGMGRMCRDEETKPSVTPRSKDPYLEATNPSLNAALIK